MFTISNGEMFTISTLKLFFLFANVRDFINPILLKTVFKPNNTKIFFTFTNEKNCCHLEMIKILLFQVGKTFHKVEKTSSDPYSFTHGL